METDLTEPWGVRLDYAGRALTPVIEQGLPVDVAIVDAEPGRRNTPMVATAITVITPAGDAAFTLASMTVPAYVGTTWQPDPAKVQAAVEQCAAAALERLQWLASLIPAPVQIPAP